MTQYKVECGLKGYKKWNLIKGEPNYKTEIDIKVGDELLSMNIHVDKSLWFPSLTKISMERYNYTYYLHFQSGEIVILEQPSVFEKCRVYEPITLLE